jgi:release factor glutamine methyltransferase
LERDVANLSQNSIRWWIRWFIRNQKSNKKSSELIKKNGKFILEIGFDQKNKVINLLKEKVFI